MADTFEKIATVTVGAGGASSIDFSSIPNTYTDLCIEISARTTASQIVDDTFISFNGSTSSFTQKELYGNGSVKVSGSFARAAGLAAGGTSTANTFGNSTTYISNYAGSAYKTYSTEATGENNGTESYLALAAGLWSNAAAINQITLTSGTSSNFVQYSTATLYGIKNS